MQLAAQFQLGNYDTTAFLLGLLSSSLSVTGYTVCACWLSQGKQGVTGFARGS